MKRINILMKRKDIRNADELTYKARDHEQGILKL